MYLLSMLFPTMSSRLQMLVLGSTCAHVLPYTSSSSHVAFLGCLRTGFIKGLRFHSGWSWPHECETSFDEVFWKPAKLNEPNKPCSSHIVVMSESRNMTRDRSRVSGTGSRGCFSWRYFSRDMIWCGIPLTLKAPSRRGEMPTSAFPSSYTIIRAQPNGRYLEFIKPPAKSSCSRPSVSSGWTTSPKKAWASFLARGSARSKTISPSVPVL